MRTTIRMTMMREGEKERERERERERIADYQE